MQTILTPKDSTISLPRLSNDEYGRVESIAKESGTPLTECPTCHARGIEVAPGVRGWENGVYRYRGREIACDCQTQIALRKHYLLAGIGEQYMRLDWEDYRGDPAAIDAVETILDKWQAFRDNGIGLEFSSTGLGTGKTFAATHIAKELIKKGEKVYFTPFLDMVSAQKNDNEIHDLLRSVPVLILDEVGKPISEAQRRWFAEEFEEIIRHRTNYNKVTIMTTNLTPDELRDTFARVYSLLEAKQTRVEMTGKDARQSFINLENLELALNGEVRPIT